MELIIDIPEEDYKLIQNYPSLYCNDLLNAIKNATPVDTEGDLISREALRKAFHERIWYFDKSSWDEANALIDSSPTVEPEKGDLISRSALRSALEITQYNDIDDLTRTEQLIDNAPTVPLPNEQIAWEQGYECGKNEKRPQGIEREIIGYEGLYSVDIFGTVRNLLSGKIIEHYVNEYGYHNVYLYKDGEKKGKRVNRLVAMAFIPNPLGKPQVNHIDGDKDNNNVWNLEWVTNKENSVHAGKTGLYGNGQVKIVETGEVFPNVSSLARYLNVDRSNIYKCLQGKRNKVRGYHFEKIGADTKGGAE